MATEQVKAFLKALKENPQAKELLDSIEAPKNDEERIRAYTEIAGKLGFHLTAEDFAAFEQAAAEERLQKTEAQAEALQKLDDQELEGVAGGRDGTQVNPKEAENGDTCMQTHESCSDTFLNQENCWCTDGCDQVFNSYDDYVCKRHDDYHSCASLDLK
ncbi:MAG: Nif11 family protein [Clostridia bacterium]|nr:Nif11 family protein [Clostridia bacterium]